MGSNPKAGMPFERYALSFITFTTGDVETSAVSSIKMRLIPFSLEGFFGFSFSHPTFPGANSWHFMTISAEVQKVQKTLCQ